MCRNHLHFRCSRVSICNHRALYIYADFTRRSTLQSINLTRIGCFIIVQLYQGIIAIKSYGTILASLFLKVLNPSVKEIIMNLGCLSKRLGILLVAGWAMAGNAPGRGYGIH
jgi:hypothetical protein